MRGHFIPIIIWIWSVSVSECKHLAEASVICRSELINLLMILKLVISNHTHHIAFRAHPCLYSISTNLNTFTNELFA